MLPRRKTFLAVVRSELGKWFPKFVTVSLMFTRTLDKRRNWKTARYRRHYADEMYLMFSVPDTTPGKFEHAKITGHFGFVFEENLVKENQIIFASSSSFSQSSDFKMFTVHTKAPITLMFFSHESAHVLTCLRLSSTIKRQKTLMTTENF